VSVVISMLLYSFSMSASPGPVNLITLSSGVNNGFRQTMPFVSGATIGFVVLLLGIGLGLSTITDLYPNLLNTFKYLGSGFVAYMGLSLFRSGAMLGAGKQSQPTFMQGALLQWLNPKAWVACLAGVSAFNASESLQQLILFSGIYFMICYLSIALWAFSGHQIQGLLKRPSFYQMFNRLMGSILILVACWLLIFDQ
jgi:threonine/homoserine/homoserine lactone efflux protein